MPHPEPVHADNGQPRFDLAAMPDVEQISPKRPIPEMEIEAPPAAHAPLISQGGSELAKIVRELRVDRPTPAARTPSPDEESATAPPMPGGRHSNAEPAGGDLLPVSTAVITEAVVLTESPAPTASSDVPVASGDISGEWSLAEQEQPTVAESPPRLVRLIQALGCDAPLPGDEVPVV